MDGNVEKLSDDGAFNDRELAHPLLKQMLQALDYLDVQGILHRDLKPANILYRSEGDVYTFKLGDFGFCNMANKATSHVGTPLFEAPELQQHGTQTAALDIWSLFVTMLWTLDIGHFKMAMNPSSVAEHLATIQRCAQHPDVKQICDMVDIDPSLRPSAEALLIRLYNGEGRTLPRPSKKVVKQRGRQGPRPTRAASRRATMDMSFEFTGPLRFDGPARRPQPVMNVRQLRNRRISVRQPIQHDTGPS